MHVALGKLRVVSVRTMRKNRSYALRLYRKLKLISQKLDTMVRLVKSIFLNRAAPDGLYCADLLKIA